MGKILWNFLLFVTAAASLQPIASEKDVEAEPTSVSDFSRCKKIKIRQLHINDEVCVKFAFVPSEIGIQISITWDGKEIFKTKISVKSPPPICFKIPFVKELKACLKLTDVSFEPHHHGACLEVELKAFMIHKTFKLGCIYKEIQDAKKKTPLEILEAVRALVNPDNVEKSDKTDWLKVSDESESVKVTDTLNPKQSLLALFAPRGMGNQVPGDNDVQTCVCSKPRQCICCKKIVLFPRYQTKVCGKVIVTKRGQGLWVSLLVDGAKHFRVYTPVSRRFKFTCGKLEIHNANAVICLHLQKVVETEQGMDVCLSAGVHAMSSTHLLSLGCLTVKIKQNGGAPTDNLVKFKPISKLVL